METKLEERIQQVEAKLEGHIQAVEGKLESLRQEVKAEINTAFNKAMLLFTAIGAVLALLTLFR
jgi:Mg2+ and Co2+ transporter CorA